MREQVRTLLLRVEEQADSLDMALVHGAQDVADASGIRRLNDRVEQLADLVTILRVADQCADEHLARMASDLRDALRCGP